MTIAKAIKMYRKKQGLTQSDLAIRANRTVRTIRRYESGEVLPTIDILEKIFINASIQRILYDNLV